MLPSPPVLPQHSRPASDVLLAPTFDLQNHFRFRQRARRIMGREVIVLPVPPNYLMLLPGQVVFPARVLLDVVAELIRVQASCVEG